MQFRIPTMNTDIFVDTGLCAMCGTMILDTSSRCQISVIDEESC